MFPQSGAIGGFFQNSLVKRSSALLGRRDAVETRRERRGRHDGVLGYTNEEMTQEGVPARPWAARGADDPHCSGLMLPP